MGESLGSRPEELYAEHKSNVERLDEMQRRLDAARVLSDILTPEQIGQIANETWIAQDEAGQQYEQNIESSKEHFESNSDDYMDQAKREMEERDQKRFEDQYLARLKHHLERALRRHKEPGMPRFSGDSYVEISDISPDQILSALPGADELAQAKNATKYQLGIEAKHLSPEQRTYLRQKRPDVGFYPSDEEQSQNPH